MPMSRFRRTIYVLLCCAVVTACAESAAERRLLSENATGLPGWYMSPSPVALTQKHGANAPMLIPAVAKSWSCRGFGGVFTVFFQIKLAVKNGGRTPLIVPSINDVASDVNIAATLDDLRTGRVELQILHPLVMSSGERRDLRASDFLTVRPSETVELPLLVEIAVPAVGSGAAMAGAALPGEKWIRFAWDPWSEEDAVTRHWSQSLSAQGQLILDVMSSEPVRILIPSNPTFADCGELERF